MNFGLQVKAARTLLGWTKGKLAKESGLDTEVIASHEAGKHAASIDQSSAIRHALRKGGVELLDADQTGGLGVRLSLARK
jgi:ribosome-binding protein aMBF1 (putative translation factor)